jgi:hypothetical protein
LLVISPIAALLLVTMFASVVSANPTYTFSVVDHNTINGGYITGWNNIIGTGPDNTWCQLYGSAAGRGAYVICGMSAPVSAGSYIAVYAKAASGYESTSQLSVYVSNDGVNFYFAGTQPIYTTSGNWYYFTSPTYPSPYPYTTFQYIYVRGVSSIGAESVFVDSVLTM